MASPNNYLFEDESATTERKMPEHEEMGPPAGLGAVERIGLGAGASSMGGLAGYLHHSASAAGYWPPLIYDWSENALGSQSLQQPSSRDESRNQ